MASEIEELLDEIVWDNMPEDVRKFCWSVFRWAQAATRDIERLKDEADRCYEERNYG